MVLYNNSSVTYFHTACVLFTGFLVLNIDLVIFGIKKDFKIEKSCALFIFTILFTFFHFWFFSFMTCTYVINVIKNMTGTYI